MKPLFAFGLLFFLLAYRNENIGQPSVSSINNKDSLLRVLTYGFSPLRGAADVFIAKQFGFRYYSVTGCIFTKELKDSIDSRNEKVYETLAQRYGVNWKQAYTRKVDSLSILFEQVKAVVNSQPNIKHTTLYYHIAPAGSAHIFNVQAFSADNNKLAYQFKVDIQTRHVDLVQ